MTSFSNDFDSLTMNFIEARKLIICTLLNQDGVKGCIYSSGIL